jgi:hypothetical protein
VGLQTRFVVVAAPTLRQRAARTRIVRKAKSAGLATAFGLVRRRRACAGPLAAKRCLRPPTAVRSTRRAGNAPAPRSVGTRPAAATHQTAAAERALASARTGKSAASRTLTARKARTARATRSDTQAARRCVCPWSARTSTLLVWTAGTPERNVLFARSATPTVAAASAVWTPSAARPAVDRAPPVSSATLAGSA